MFIPRNQKKVQDAQSYLKNLKKKLREDCKKRENENLREVTKLEVYKKLKKELAEIEFTETEKSLKDRKEKSKKVKENNLKNHDSSLKPLSKLHITISSLSKQLESLDSKILKNNKTIEKLKKPVKPFTTEYSQSLKTLQEDINNAEAKLYVLKTCEDLSESPEKFGLFISKLNTFVEPENTTLRNNETWMGSSGVGQRLQGNYQLLKNIEEEILANEKLLNCDPELDEWLVRTIEEKLRKEQESLDQRYKKKLQKKLEDLEFVYQKELGVLGEKLEDLSGKLSLQILKKK